MCSCLFFMVRFLVLAWLMQLMTGPPSYAVCFLWEGRGCGCDFSREFSWLRLTFFSTTQHACPPVKFPSAQPAFLSIEFPELKRLPKVLLSFFASREGSPRSSFSAKGRAQPPIRHLRGLPPQRDDGARRVLAVLVDCRTPLFFTRHLRALPPSRFINYFPHSALFP